MFHSLIVSLSRFLNVFLSQTILCADLRNAKGAVDKAVPCYNVTIVMSLHTLEDEEKMAKSFPYI